VTQRFFRIALRTHRWCDDRVHESFDTRRHADLEETVGEDDGRSFARLGIMAGGLLVEDRAREPGDARVLAGGESLTAPT